MTIRRLPVPVRLVMLAAASLSAVAPAYAQHTPVVGSSERRAILEPLRPSMEAKFGVPIQFKLSRLCVADGWAVVLADPQRKDGSPAPWHHALSQEEYDLGGDQVSAVLRFHNSRWNLIDSAIGATDVWYEGLVPRRVLEGC